MNAIIYLSDLIDKYRPGIPAVLICNTGGRSYEAQITLDEKGFKDVINLHGGFASLGKRAFSDSLLGEYTSQFNLLSFRWVITGILWP